VSRFFESLLRTSLVFGLLAFATGAYAGAITDISESTSTGGELFGPATEQGDLAVDFNPTMFKSLSTGAESEIVDSQLSFMVTASPILKVWIKESGDYALIGGPGTTATAQVNVDVFWEVVEIDGVAVPGMDGQTSASLGNFSLPASGFAAGSWDGMVEVDIEGFLAANSVTGRATKVNFTLDNKLSTASVVGSSAFVAKKDVDIIIHVPEPASASLLGMGAVALLLGTRRRR
jgi:hypothetical protein